MQTIGRINNMIGAFYGVGVAPPAGTSVATATAQLSASEITDASNKLRLGIEADFGSGYRWMAWGPDWSGGPGQTAPTLSWQFKLSNPPLRVRVIIENGIGGVGSPAVVNEVDLAFA